MSTITTPTSEPPILTIDGVSKSFPNVKALTNLELEVRAGEVMAIVGENGAGKSTLLKILSGDYGFEEGVIKLGGVKVNHASPRDARRAGFRLVRQEPEIVPHISVAENIFVGEYPTKNFAVDFGAMRRKTLELLETYRFAGFVHPDALGSSLSPAQKHIVEIMRALKEGVKVVAFDEPTSSLTADETYRLFDLIKLLRAQGLGVIYVSHRLHEIMSVADRICVLRDGKLVGVRARAETTSDEIVRMMVGRDLTQGFRRKDVSKDEVVLEVTNLNSRWHHDVSFTIRAGEILGFAGLVGAGRTELAKVLFGALPKISGEVKVGGKVMTIRAPSDAIAANLGFAPEDRKKEGLILVRSVLENTSLAVYSALSRFGVLRTQEMAAKVSPYIDYLAIKTPSLEQEVSKLSGGNQQKVVLARWLAAKPKVLILDEPTRAVDVGAKAEIYRLMDELARSGIAIMLISSEMPELLSVADRIRVMRDGTLSEPVERADATEENILSLALGQKAA